MKKRIFLMLLCVVSLAVALCLFTACEGKQGPQGENGVTPQLKIGDDNYWYVSYNNGTTWQPLGVKATGGSEEETGTEGLEYYPLPDGTYGVAASTTNHHRVVIIPTEYKGKAVTEILSKGFKDSTNLVAVSIPDSITSIGDSAFYGCTELEIVTIPDSITNIGDSAFYGCSGLGSITIPDKVTIIGEYAFFNCTGLRSIKYRGSQTQWNGITMGLHWDRYYVSSGTGYRTISYTMTYNYTGE